MAQSASVHKNRRPRRGNPSQSNPSRKSSTPKEKELVRFVDATNEHRATAAWCNMLVSFMSRRLPDTHPLYIRCKWLLSGDTEYYLAPVCALNQILEAFAKADRETQKTVLAGWPANADRPSRAHLNSVERALANHSHVNHVLYLDHLDQPLVTPDWELSGDITPVRVIIRSGTDYGTAVRQLTQALQLVTSNWPRLLDIANEIEPMIVFKVIDGKPVAQMGGKSNGLYADGDSVLTAAQCAERFDRTEQSYRDEWHAVWDRYVALLSPVEQEDASRALVA